MLKLSSWGMRGYSGGGSLVKMAAFPDGVQLTKLSSRLLFIPFPDFRLYCWDRQRILKQLGPSGGFQRVLVLGDQALQSGAEWVLLLGDDSTRQVVAAHGWHAPCGPADRGSFIGYKTPEHAFWQQVLKEGW